MRTKKIFLNMVCDIIPYLLIGVIGLIKVNFLIKYIGDIGNGYYQTINQIITYVFLAQIGFGDAVTFTLYKEFAENDKKDINRIYSGSRKIFKTLGKVILSIILVVSILLYLFYRFEEGYKISSLICFIIISCSYLISYFGEGQTLLAVLSASQNKYIYSLVFNSIKMLCDLSIILVSFKFSSLESIAITILLYKILEEIVLRIVMKKKFPWLHKVKKENIKMFKMTKDLAGVQIFNIILNNVDSILIITFLGPVFVSIYTSYMYICRYLNEICSKVESSVVSSFGNVFANNEEEKIYPLFKELLVLFTVIAIIVSITFNLGIRSFIKVWIGKENYLLSYSAALLFTGYLFLYIISLPLLALINAKGYFKENKNHIFTCAIINIVISLLLVKKYKLNGLLIGTCLAFLINILLKIKTVQKNIFNNSKINIYKSYTKIIILTLILTLLCKNLEAKILIISNSFVETIILIIGIFISLTMLIIGISTTCSKSARNLLGRIKIILKAKTS